MSCYPSSWLAPEYVDAHFSVSRFYSRTNSFLKIAPEPKQLRCNQQKTVTVHYSLNGEAYGDDSNINFFYLVSLSWWILGSCLIVCLAQCSLERVCQSCHGVWVSRPSHFAGNTMGSIKNKQKQISEHINKHIKRSKAISISLRRKNLLFRVYYFKYSIITHIKDLWPFMRVQH